MKPSMCQEDPSKSVLASHVSPANSEFQRPHHLWCLAEKAPPALRLACQVSLLGTFACKGIARKHSRKFEKVEVVCDPITLKEKYLLYGVHIWVGLKEGELPVAYNAQWS